MRVYFALSKSIIAPSIDIRLKLDSKLFERRHCVLRLCDVSTNPGSNQCEALLGYRGTRKSKVQDGENVNIKATYWGAK